MVADHSAEKHAELLQHCRGYRVARERGDIGHVCLAVAGPVDGDFFQFTNSHWQLSREAFCADLQVD
ncbi:glucokinase, partial [Pseudomonas syringae]|uniref:glucokinase n=1 Tax=Pseudomonas syringae TaxID=317 RepID=UPI001F35E1CE